MAGKKGRSGGARTPRDPANAKPRGRPRKDPLNRVQRNGMVQVWIMPNDALIAQNLMLHNQFEDVRNIDALFGYAIRFLKSAKEV